MKKKLLLGAIVFTLLLTSCGQPAESPTPRPTPLPTATVTKQKQTATPTEVAPEPTQKPTAVEGGVITGEAVVESIEILLLESFPIQVHVVARGNLPDSCTEISEITKGRDGNTFRVTITTSHPADKMCAEMLVSFEEVIPLDVYGLSAGTYTVDVNGVTGSFILDVDNVLPEGEAPSAGLPDPASVYCEEQGYTVEIRTDENGNQYGVCVFPDGSECEEWAYYRGECSPAGQSVSTPAQTGETTIIAPTKFPTPFPIDSADYQGWWTYTSATYGFSLLLPTDWVVDETTTGDPLMNGHLLNLHPQNTDEILNIRMTFRRVGEDILLWPTGVGAGEFAPQGMLDVAGKPVQRMLFVCPTGQVNSIWYHGESGANIQRGGLEFGFIFSYTGVYCEEGYSLDGKVQHVGEMIIASLQVP